MAKGKSAKPAKTKSSSLPKSAAKTPDDIPAIEPDPVVARSPGVLSSIEIGYVAGDVWGILVRDGALTVAAIKKEIDAPADIVLAAIGWLAREDKLDFTSQGRSVKVSLR